MRGTGFEFPEPVDVVPLSHILDMKNKKASDTIPHTKMGVRNLHKAFLNMAKKGVNPLKTLCLVDVSTGNAREPHWVQGMSPCITRSRGGSGGYWITTLARMTRVQEMLELQGVPQSVRRKHISDHQLGLMVIRLDVC